MKDGTIFRIPRPLLHKGPKLRNESPWSQTVRLEITQEVGHTLVHYLFTDTYQCLAPKGRSPHEKVAAELTTSIRVYALAREYELFSLQELAKLEIERLGNGLRFSVVLGLVRDAYPDPSADDTWFSNYLKSGLESLLQNPSELSDCVAPNAERKTLSVSDLLFKNLVELVHNHDILPLAPSAASPVEMLEESAFLMPAPELGSPEEAAPGLDDSDFPNTCEPDQELEKKEDDDNYGFYISKRDNTKENKKASQTFELEPEPEPEPVQERALDPEPEESKEEDMWGHPVSKKTKDKEGKKASWTVELEPEPEPVQERALDPEPEESKEVDMWGLPLSKKTKKGKKKKKLQTVELVPESERELALDPEPEESREEDMRGSQKTKDKKGKKKKLQTLESELEPGDVSEFFGTRWTFKSEADPEHAPLEEVAHEEEVEAGLAATDDWSFCESDGKETKPNPGCSLRAEHVFGNGWEECHSCQDFIRQLSRQLKEGD